MAAAKPTEVTRVLIELTRDLGAVLDPTSALERALGALGQLLPVEGGVLWLDGGDGMYAAAAQPAALVDEPAVLTVLRSPLVSLGQVVGELAVHVDPDVEAGPTDRLLVEAAAAQVAAALERARLFHEVMELERLKSDFIARVSHELRTPITIINGFVDTLLAHEDRLDPEQRRHMLERSHAAAARLARLIEELLIVSRLEAGVLTPDPAPVPLDVLLEEVRVASASPDDVTIDAPAGTIVHSDRAMLARALGCVIDNAVKYGETARVRVMRDGSAWRFEVRDEGPGFADDIRSTAFEMFTRGSAANAVPGLGVGLAITRTLVEVMNGTIELAGTDDGGGATVRITLPG
jgi:K+-sensing histidine kinase KdpD